jgi:pyruvate dehydrogenase E1 component
LQHQDGSSHLVAATVPNCRAYDPCFAHELAVIVEEGMQAMLERNEDVFYYLTVMNENYAHIDPTASLAQREGIVRGMYVIKPVSGMPQIRLLGSGAILREVLAAAELLEQDFGISAAVYSVTSYSELQRGGMLADRARLQAMAGKGGDAHARSWVEQSLGAESTPVIAASDYVRALPELIRSQIAAPYVTLGTDGFGRSDTRAALRRFFEVDKHHVVLQALAALVQAGNAEPELVAQAAQRYELELPAAASWQR